MTIHLHSRSVYGPLWLVAVALVSLVASSQCVNAQTEVLTVQGNLPRLNYRDNGGNLLWSLPANSVLWKIDGPINSGVVVVTAAAKSGTMTMNEGGVSIRGGGFPDAKLVVGNMLSATEPGQVSIDPGNTVGNPTIYATNMNMPTQLVLETLSPPHGAAIRMTSTKVNFAIVANGNLRIQDITNNVSPLTIVPGLENNNALVIRNGNVGFKVLNPTNPIQLANGARCTTGGVWTNASSRELKHDINELSTDNAKATLKELQPVVYTYNHEPDEQHAGFIAEDVPALVATNSRKDLSPMDFVAVLTKVVQDQEQRIEHQDEQLKQQANLIQQQSKLLERLSKKLDELDK